MCQDIIMVVINLDPLHYWQLRWGMWSVLHDRQQTAVQYLLSTLQVTLEASLAQQFSQQEGKAHSFLKRAWKPSSWTAFPPNLVWVSTFNYTHLKTNVSTPIFQISSGAVCFTSSLQSCSQTTRWDNTETVSSAQQKVFRILPVHKNQSWKLSFPVSKSLPHPHEANIPAAENHSQEYHKIIYTSPNT